MIGVLTTGVTGTVEHQKWLDNIADNVSNINSDGFRRTRTTFADLMSRSVGEATAPRGDTTIGGINPRQIGTGVGIATMETIHTQGHVRPTENITDLAIEGEGFFIINGGGENLYTRNGNFGFDADGNLVYKPNGYKVQGFDEQGLLGDIKVDMNDIMAPEATTQISFDGQINKDQAKGIEDVVLDNGNILKFKKVLGTDDTYNYYPVDARGNLVVAKASSQEAADITLRDAAGTITVNGQTFYLNNYNTINELMAAVENATGVDMNYENGILTISAATALDDLEISETGDSLMGVKIKAGSGQLVQDYFEGFGTLHNGSVIGTVSGRITGGTIDGITEGIIVGVAGNAQIGRTATITGEIIGHLEGSFDGKGMAYGEIKQFKGYLKGDVFSLAAAEVEAGGMGGSDVNPLSASPNSNAWIDGKITGTTIASMNGTMTGYLRTGQGTTGAAPGNGPNTYYMGGFKIDGHIVGFAQADTEKGIYGSIIGDAGVSNPADIDNPANLDAVTINGPGKIQGSVGGEYDTTGTIDGAESILDMIVENANPTAAATYDSRATLDNVKVDGAVFGILTGNVTGDLYEWTGAAWSYRGQVYGMNVDGITGAVIGTFTGDITGIAQGDITMDDTSTVIGVVMGLHEGGIDHDGNGISDAYITIDKEGSLVGDFEGQVDIYGQIFSDETQTTATGEAIDWVSADVNVVGSAAGTLNGTLIGTANGEAHGEIYGLIKHATINAQHFDGEGYTMEDGEALAAGGENDHLNIKFEGTAIGYLRGVDTDLDGTIDADSNGPGIISDLVESWAKNGAYINGIVEGFLSVRGNPNDANNVTEQYVIGRAEGTISLTAGDTTGADIDTIEGEIIGEITSSAVELEGDYKGYFRGTGEVEGLFEGTLGGANPSTFEGEFEGTINGGHMVGWAEGFIQGAGPVSGMVDLDGVTFIGKFKGLVELAANETMVGSFDGKMSGQYNGQVDAEKKDIPGLFTAANVATGTYNATGGQVVVADGEEATVAGVEVTANKNYKISRTITVYDQLGQTTKLRVTLENLGDGEWNITTSDGGQGKITFNPTDGRIASVDYDGQYELDLASIVQLAGINEIVMTQDGHAKGHLQRDKLSIGADGTIRAMYDNGLSKELGQIAVATFDNNSGLARVGTTMFAPTQNSGEARVEEAGSIRSGSIRSKALEGSNVDLTQELANMILAQQAFTVGIRMITTGDRLITEVLRMRP